jgi:SAM-dependent methyltransferase
MRSPARWVKSCELNMHSEQKMKKHPIALAAYEALAESYAARIDTKAHNAYYERPATLSLLPDVKGRRVLDAGCGPGVYTRLLADREAEVTALDVSPRMVELARKRVGTRATIRQADIEQGLGFLQDASFDIVLSSLVLDYIEDLGSVFKEYYRVLVPGGAFIFSCGHPFANFLTYKTEDYFRTDKVEWEWKGFGTPVTVPSYRRPLNAVLNPLIEAGFILDRILEPQPTEQFRQKEPEDYEKLMKQPGFICVRARKS